MGRSRDVVRKVKDEKKEDDKGKPKESIPPSENGKEANGKEANGKDPEPSTEVVKNGGKSPSRSISRSKEKAAPTEDDKDQEIRRKDESVVTKRNYRSNREDSNDESDVDAK